MGKKRGGLGDGKGGGLLAGLRDRLTASPPPPPTRDADAQLAEAMARRGRKPPPPTPQARAATQKQKAKRKKDIVTLPRAVADAVRATFPALATSSKSSPIAVNDLGEAAFNKLAALQATLEGFATTFEPPAAVPDATVDEVERMIALGSAEAGRRYDRDDGYFVGYDFGTSATKAVLRHWTKRGAAFALDVPEGLAGKDAVHLWPSVVFVGGDGGVSLCPGSGRTALTGFKAALIERQGHRTRAPGLTMEEAATAFLALHLAYVFGALVASDPGARIAGVHIAVPVASLGDQAARAAFDRVTRAALGLLPHAPGLTLARVRAALADPAAPAITPELHAELSGAIAGYCAQPRRFAGAHMIVDCGSATLDIASFQLGEGTWPIGIHAAAVERLGADACALFTRRGASEAECRAAARFAEQRVYGATLDHARAAFQQGPAKRFPYQVILTGGGMAGATHRAVFDRMERAFERRFHRPQLPADLAHHHRADPARLSIADGLARDPYALGEVLMPRDRPVIYRRPDPEAVTKDQV